MPEQNLTYDDFEMSLKEEGIEIIVPEEDGEAPEGIGASGYKPRLTAPSTTNPYYLKYGRGGYNRCILIGGNSCLANCVGYAHGRLLEQGGSTGNAKIPTCNAEDWLATAKANGLKTGKTPKIGAVIVWKSGNLWNGRDGCGHVAVVEEVHADGSILVSQSNYGGTRFFLTRHQPPYNIFGQTFIGFIYSPYVEESKGTGKAMWKKDSKGWWYQNADGSYPKNCWQKIAGYWYHFDEAGYMQTGWIKDKGTWYLLGETGAMLTGWQKRNGKWYYMNESGEMQTGWLHLKRADGKYRWYYCDDSGAMVTGTQTVVAYFNSDGELERK